jgi:tetratricopeptide (TPR) repeat protein
VSTYDVARIDQLEALPVDDEGLTWRPIRRRFGIEAFGANAYTASRAGQRVVEEHREARNAHEELYVVVSGRARFKLENEEVDAPAGTLVFVRPHTLRGAIAAEPETTILALGGRPGESFKPSAWEWAFVAGSYHRQGRNDEALAVMREGIERYPDEWQGYYNLACIESRIGRRDDALESLQRAVELAPDEVRGYAATDEELAAIRDDPRFLRIAG